MNNFLSTLVETNQTANYYLDINDILQIENRKDSIKQLDKLVGNEDFDNTLRNILINDPDIIEIIPLLVGSRDESINLLVEYSYTKKWVTKTYLFKSKNLTKDKIENIVEFFEIMGLKRLYIEKRIENTYDYMMAMHMGLRVNARKNKSGKFMEDYIEGYIRNICNKYNLSYLSQPKAEDILKEYNIDVKNVLKSRKPDFVINNNGKLILIEVNFYNTSGSKIKSTTNEYIKLNAELKECPIIQDFVWITDGQAWLKEKKNLERAFYNIDNIININDTLDGYIEKLICKN